MFTLVNQYLPFMCVDSNLSGKNRYQIFYFIRDLYENIEFRFVPTINWAPKLQIN